MADKGLVVALLFVVGIFASAFFGIGYYDCSFVLRVPNVEPVGLVRWIPYGFMRNLELWTAGFWCSITFTMVNLVIGLRAGGRRGSGGW